VNDTPREPIDPERAMIERARRRYGSLGAVVAGGMLGIDKILGRKPKEEIPAVWEASGEPGDIDSDGIAIPIDESTSVTSHPRRSAARTRAVRRRRVQG
jgi:hypothetical protein